MGNITSHFASCHIEMETRTLDGISVHRTDKMENGSVDGVDGEIENKNLINAHKVYAHALNEWPNVNVFVCVCVFI